jgi:hypothetical protein
MMEAVIILLIIISNSNRKEKYEAYKWWMRRVISKNQIADIYIKYFRDKWNVKCEFYRFFITEMNNEELKFLPFFT